MTAFLHRLPAEPGERDHAIAEETEALAAVRHTAPAEPDGLAAKRAADSELEA